MRVALIPYSPFVAGVALIPCSPFVAGTALALPNLSCDICSPGGASIRSVAVIMHVCMRTFMYPCRDTRP